MREAAEFACPVNTPPSLGFEDALMNGVSERRLLTNHVITDTELTVFVADPNRAARWQAYIGAGAKLYCYDGQNPCNRLVDETVHVLDRQPDASEGTDRTNPTIRV